MSILSVTHLFQVAHFAYSKSRAAKESAVAFLQRHGPPTGFFSIFRRYLEMRSRLVRTLLIWRREIQSRRREQPEGESKMSRPLTIRWEERDQVWQAPAGEFYTVLG